MPMSRRQFELGVNNREADLMREVYEWLTNHSDLAYSVSEIAEALLGPEPVQRHGMDIMYLDKALDVLVGIGALEQRIVRGTGYYAFLQEFDTGTWLSAKHTSPR